MRLGQRDRQVEEQRALPGLLDGLGPQLALAFGGGVRLGGQQLRRTGRRLCGRCPAGGRAECRRGLYARRTEDRTVGARRSGRARSRGPSRRGPTSGRAVLLRSGWPGCSSWPRPWPGRGRLASRCSQGHSPCSGLRQPPRANPPPAATAGLSMLIAWCMGVELRLTMHPGWQNGRSRSETRKGLNGHCPLPTNLSYRHHVRASCGFLPSKVSHRRPGLPPWSRSRWTGRDPARRTQLR